jgi:hypothetical protein
MINGLWESGDGPIKTFPLRGIKDSPPYMHDGRLLTLEDTIEFFNLILGTKLSHSCELFSRRRRAADPGSSSRRDLLRMSLAAAVLSTN